MDITKIDKDQLRNSLEPTDDEIWEYMRNNKFETYYTAREKLREKAYGGKPPDGYGSWGDYWKSY